MPALFLGTSIFTDYCITNTNNDNNIPGLLIAVTGSTLPIAAGLGSSAAVSVSQAAALLDIYSKWKNQTNTFGIEGEIVNQRYTCPNTKTASSSTTTSLRPSSSILKLINHWAYSSEMLFHGSPSGLDNTVAT